MITQYSNNGSFGSPSADIQNIVANSVSVLDQYILFQTGQNEYTALIKNLASKEVEQIVISRSSSSGSSAYSVNRSSVADFEYSVSNEYYTYSNVGIGKSLDIPSYEGIQTYGLTFIVCVLCFAILFKGALFKCLKSKR